jgi:hypothetical protein
MKIIRLHHVVALWQGARLKSHSAGRVAQPTLTGIVPRKLPPRMYICADPTCAACRSATLRSL